MSTSFAVIFIIGKAMIWLALPAAIGIWELRRHRRMMAMEARGEPVPPAIPAWLAARPASVRGHRRPDRTAPALPEERKAA